MERSRVNPRKGLCDLGRDTHKLAQAHKTWAARERSGTLPKYFCLEFSVDYHYCSYPRGSSIKKENKVRYEVRIGLTQQMEFSFDCMGDALDFAATCLENGYRVVVIPLEDNEDEI